MGNDYTQKVVSTIREIWAGLILLLEDIFRNEGR